MKQNVVNVSESDFETNGVFEIWAQMGSSDVGLQLGTLQYSTVVSEWTPKLPTIVGDSIDHRG